MKKKIITILISLVFISSLNVLAGNINDPEITDDEDDWFGSFIDHPIRYQLFHAIGLLPMETFDFLDIKSAWFYEESDEPDYLFVSLRLKDLEVISQRAVYSIHWTFNGERYAIGSHIYNNGLNTVFSVNSKMLRVSMILIMILLHLNSRKSMLGIFSKAIF